MFAGRKRFTIVFDVFGVFAGRIDFVQRAGALRILRIERDNQRVPVHHVREFPDDETLLGIPDPHLLILHPGGFVLKQNKVEATRFIIVYAQRVLFVFEI